MRWDNLTIEAEERSALPGYREPAVIRHFDAPEALNTRFYEVRARSALNRVPDKSRMPFRWTINPYRGCTHACLYCLGPDTPVLLANGRTRAIAQLRVGDQIVGTETRGAYRRYVTTEVLAHWSTVKPAYRVTLEDGTELVTSGDHRFLSNRGWKHVSRSAEGRPHLTTSHELLGTGQFAAPPEGSLDYMRGYLSGALRGEGLADLDALRRMREYLAHVDLAAGELVLARAGGARGETGVRRRSHASRDSVDGLVRWPLSPSDDWRKGFLAGVYDGAGTCTGQVLRVEHDDAMVLGWTRACLSHFGFAAAQESPPSGASAIRLRGGLRERLRFFHLTDPAITRKRTVQGLAIKSDAQTRVASIESLGIEIPMYDITTGTGDFIANGVVSHNCFARPTHKYLDFDAGRDFEREIVVKVNAPEVLRVELARPSWKGEHVAMGTNTDPYQWVEGRYQLMRGIWAALRDARNECSVLTKSPLLLRDLDLMLEIAEVAPVSANLSVPTIDEKAWRASEPHTPNPRARLEAVAELSKAGIPTGVLVAPLMPGINDDPRQVEEILRLAGEAGARSVSGITLHLRGEVRGVFMDWLKSYRPDLVEHYEELYARGAYAPRAEQDRISGILRHARARTRKAFGTEPRPGFGQMGRGIRRVTEASGSERAGEQARLF